eukprot:1828315-Rhodomonas_salina.1
MSTEDGRLRREKVEWNIGLTGLGERYRIIPTYSFVALNRLLVELCENDNEATRFDVVYIDGSHRADNTLLDAEMCFRLANQGCLIVFDDYEWDKEPKGNVEHPQLGIQAFVEMHQRVGQLEIVSKGYQLFTQRTAAPYLGFLTLPDQLNVDNAINVLFCADHNFIVPCCVAIASLLEHSQHKFPISIYVVDVGLSQGDELLLQHIVQDSQKRATLSVLQIPPYSLPEKEFQVQGGNKLPVPP